MIWTRRDFLKTSVTALCISGAATAVIAEQRCTPFDEMVLIVYGQRGTKYKSKCIGHKWTTEGQYKYLHLTFNPIDVTSRNSVKPCKILMPDGTLFRDNNFCDNVPVDFGDQLRVTYSFSLDTRDPSELKTIEDLYKIQKRLRTRRAVCK